MLRSSRRLLMVVLVGLGAVSCCDKRQSLPPAEQTPTVSQPPAPPAPAKPQAASSQWRSLFNGKELGNWKSTDFGGEGKVFVEDGVLHLPFGNDMTGVTWQGEPPFRMNYELELEAKRVEGSDFFAGITFPVGKDNLSLILGGWGGGLIGISSFDGMDASENDTSTWADLEQGRWYKVRLRVTPRQIEMWLDDKKMIDKVYEGHSLDVRIEVELSKPLGIATWQTHGALRSIRWRPVDGPADPAPKD